MFSYHDYFFLQSTVYQAPGGQKPFREKVSGLPKASYKGFLLPQYAHGPDIFMVSKTKRWFEAFSTLFLVLPGDGKIGTILNQVDFSHIHLK